MSVEQNLREMELHREKYWLRYPQTSPLKLRWRAIAVRHCFHVLPGESILELGAGSGLWTEHLTDVLRGENPITAAVFNSGLADQALEKQLAERNRGPGGASSSSDLPEAQLRLHRRNCHSQP